MHPAPGSPWILSSLALLLLALPLSAIEIAVPGNFFEWSVEIPGDPNPDVFYYLSPNAVPVDEGANKSFLMVIDGAGQLRYFDSGHKSNFFPIEHAEQYAHTVGRAGDPDVFRVLDSEWNIVEDIPSDHPNHPGWWMDGHELLFMEDGSRWTLWWETRQYDMGDFLPGGQDDVTVSGHVVQHWDTDGSVIWSWRSLDYIDALPFTHRPDSSALYGGAFEHLHVNSVDVHSDAVYLSCRNISKVVKVNRATGEVAWRMGTGPGNDFTFTSAVPDTVPLEFNYQHDARFDPATSRLTVFDNGLGHTPQRSYAREYIIDEDSLTAELVWVHHNTPPTFARITGTHRVLDNGNHLIGWGNRYPEIAASEVTPDGDLVWQVTFETDDEINRRPATYRVYKSTQFTALESPRLDYRVVNNGDVEITTNWFGYEDKVAAWHVYRGFVPDDLQFVTAIETGYFYDSNSVPLQPRYYQFRGVDASGDFVEPFTDVVEVVFTETGIRAVPVAPQDLPETGGTVYYAIQIVNASNQNWIDAAFRTYILRPNGNEYGPLVDQTFSLNAFNSWSAANLSQPIPDWLEGGEFEFIAEIQIADNEGYRDTFPFTKQGDPGLSWGDDEPPWPVGSGLPGLSQPADREASAIPGTFTLAAPYPNPFNAQATATVTLPREGWLTVTLVNLLGQTVAHVHDGVMPAGRHMFTLDGSALASGLYFVQAHMAGHPLQTRKLMLLR